jgi:hypothetical protein
MIEAHEGGVITGKGARASNQIEEPGTVDRKTGCFLGFPFAKEKVFGPVLPS